MWKPGSIIVFMLLCAGLAGCDLNPLSDKTIRSSVEIDLSVLHPPATAVAAEHCMWIARNLVVSAGGRTQCDLPVGPEDRTASCPVEVSIGTVDFEANLFSKNGMLLYTGTTTAEVEEDNFFVSLPLRPERPILQLCTLEPGSFTAFNRGIDSLNWFLEFPRTCRIAFELREGSIAGGDSQHLPYFGSTPTFCAGRISSPEGDIKICPCSGLSAEACTEQCCGADNAFC